MAGITRLRTGRKVGRTLYAQNGPAPSDADVLIGLLDGEWAELVAHAYNAWLDAAETDTHRHFWIEHSSFGFTLRSCPCGVTVEIE